MDYVALKNELDTDPLVRGYSGMTDQEAADDLNSVYRTRNRSFMTGKEVKDRIDTAEWAGRSDAQKQIVLSLVTRDDLDPFGIDATIFQDAMSGATATLASLLAYRVEDISRAEELNLGFVRAPDVDAARRSTV